MAGGRHAQGMQHTYMRTLTPLQQIAQRISVIQNNFNVLYQNNLYSVTFTRANILHNIVTRYEVKFIRPISTINLAQCCMAIAGE